MFPPTIVSASSPGAANSRSCSSKRPAGPVVRLFWLLMHVIVPVHVKNMNGVASISLTLLYDNAVLSYNNYQNSNPALAGNLLSITNYGDKIVLSWFSFGGSATIADDVLFEIDFTYLGGSGPLTWDMTPGACQYADMLPVSSCPQTFINGSVDQQA
jgi:hypothetical protein